MAQVLEILSPCGGPGWNSCFLALAWSSSHRHCGFLRRETASGRPLSLSLVSLPLPSNKFLKQNVNLYNFFYEKQQKIKAKCLQPHNGQRAPAVVGVWFGVGVGCSSGEPRRLKDGLPETLPSCDLPAQVRITHLWCRCPVKGPVGTGANTCGQAWLASRGWWCRKERLPFCFVCLAGTWFS